METEEERIRREQKNAEREDELKRIPVQTIDKSRWPRYVRPISMGEADGLGIDNDGRLYWNGKPVEIIGRRVDLTWMQSAIGIAVALFTIVGGIGCGAQGWVAYHDWACKNHMPAGISCPSK
ncbi:hypothetical protein [Bradyrhizobium australafricanum]|uniref:hypothetical protein n=1 Tax=Bradyrhizobium australafricanum TaxID=2821406 RepID=UPI001CE2E680|nr:hypothetical protein [Bradyrhizobium australafricanum]MCA6099203.1 hypothetical protein [Bradyrhizobium australafricanum]